VVRRVTLDAQLVAAIAEGEPRARAHLEAFRRNDVEVVVPAPVIVQSTTGMPGRDARVDTVIAGCRVMDTTEDIARRAAALRYEARRPDATVAAIVVATSELVGGRMLLAGDPAGCVALAGPTSVRVEAP
jgi:hypothetical protein